MLNALAPSRTAAERPGTPAPVPEPGAGLPVRRLIFIVLCVVLAPIALILVGGFIYSRFPNPPPRISLRLVGYQRSGTNLVATLVLTNAGPSVAWIGGRDGWATEGATLTGRFTNSSAGHLTWGHWPFGPNSELTKRVVLPATSLQWRTTSSLGFYKRRNPRMELVAFVYASSNRLAIARFFGPVLECSAYLLHLVGENPIEDIEVVSDTYTNLPVEAPEIPSERVPDFRPVTGARP